MIRPLNDERPGIFSVLLGSVVTGAGLWAGNKLMEKAMPEAEKLLDKGLTKFGLKAPTKDGPRTIDATCETVRTDDK